MLEDLKGNTFEYKKLSADEQKARGILGRLVGPIADFKHATRNGRLYSQQLWENVFNDPIMQEKIKNRLVLGELGHPADRSEIDMEKVAICLAEVPKKNSDGKLMGVFDILSTPNGKILKTLCDYGCKVGISSRGQGDVVEDFSDTPKVDPSTYQCETWDIVLIPGVKDARLTYVNESLENKQTLKQALTEQLSQASDDDKKIMNETLRDLNIEYTPEKVIDKSNMVANNAGTNVIKELQDSLLANKKLEDKITELQEKLSVCYAKEAKVEEDVEKYKTAIRNLSESASNAKALQTKLDSLNEQLKEKDLVIEQERSKQKRLLESKTNSIDREKRLNENLSQKSRDVSEARKEIKTLKENFDNLKKEFNDEKTSLQESLAETRKNLTIKTNEYNTKLDNCNKLVEQYRATAKKAVNKYIECKAVMLGVDSQEILNKLPSNYSFTDIDTICESLSDYKLSVSNLPFELKKDTKIKIIESKQNDILPKSRFDDHVDESLLRLAGLNED